MNLLSTSLPASDSPALIADIRTERRVLVGPALGVGDGGNHQTDEWDRVGIG
jgi:hypothetical protein